MREILILKPLINIDGLIQGRLSTNKPSNFFTIQFKRIDSRRFNVYMQLL
jgi:hypothetical protein